MSARKTFPNFRVQTCKNLSMQNIDSLFEFGNSAEKKEKKIETSRQGDVMRPKEKTFLKVRDSVLQLSVFTPHADIYRENLSTFEISVHSTDRHAMSV